MMRPAKALWIHGIDPSRGILYTCPEHACRIWLNHLISFSNPSRCLLPVVHCSPPIRLRHAPSIVVVDSLFPPVDVYHSLIFHFLLFPITRSNSLVYDPRDDFFF